MKINAFISSTIFDATKDMIGAIDYSDFSVEHIVIVPDRFSLQMEKLLLTTLKNKALFNVKVMGLTSLAIEIFKRLNMNIEVLSSGESLLLLQNAIDNVKADFKVFKKSGIAFCHEISKIISQLKSSGISCDDLNEKTGGLTGGKYHDIMLIYKEYQNMLAGKFDANERMMLLNQVLKDSDILSKTKFYFAQFDSFTTEGYDLIKTIITKSCEVNVSIASPLSIGNEYIYEKDILQKFSMLSRECGCEIDVRYSHQEYSPQKQALIKGLYSYEETKCKNDGFYTAFSAQNTYDEVSCLAKLIYYYTINGYSYNDIMVATSDVEKYSNLIEEIFSKYDIPYYIDSSTSADKSLLANLVFNFFETVYYGYTSENIQTLLSNILLGDNAQLIYNCQKYVVDNKRKYNQYLAKDFKYDYILKGIENSKTSVDFQNVILQICETVRPQLDELFIKLEEKNYIKERDINRQIEDILIETTKLITKYNSEPISLGAYLKELKLLLSFKEVSTVPAYVDCVMIGDTTNSFYGECKIMFILGSQSLPIINNDNGLLSDQDMELNFVDKKLQPTIRMINRRNRFKLFNILTIPTEKLIVFMQAISDEGKKNEAPAFVDFLNKIFSQLIIRSMDVFDSTNTNLEQAFLTGIGNRENFLCEYFAKFDDKTKDEYKLELNNLRNLDINKKSIENGEELYFDKNKVYVTELEQYFSCPFKHFITYGLKLKEKEIYQIDPRDTGNICHKGAELFVKTLMKMSPPYNIDVNDFINKKFHQIVDEASVKEKLESASEKASLIKFYKHQLEVILNDILTEIQASEFKPSYIEYKLNNLELGGNKKVTISGKVDRIDEAGDYFRIIDYKTGRTGNIIKELYFGNKLQLFLYQKIVKKMLNKVPAGVFYFNAKYDYAKNEDDKILLKGIVENDDGLLAKFDKNIKYGSSSKILNLSLSNDGKYGGSAIAKENLKVYEDYAKKIADNAVDEIVGGYIEPKPNEESCNYCKYNSICQYEKINGKRKNNKIGDFKDIKDDEE